MKGSLRDITINSQISSLPNVVNTNNRIITAEFDNIFDASNNVLIKSVDASAGMVRAHWGYFVNIDVDHINIKDTSSSLGDLLKNVEHNSLGKRMFDDFLPEERLTEDYYAHDINMIKGLPKTLAIMNASIAILWKSLSIKKPNGGQYNDSLTGTVIDASIKYSGPDWQVDPDNPDYVYPVNDTSTSSARMLYDDYIQAKANDLGIEHEMLKSIQQTGTYSFKKKVDTEYVNVLKSDVIKYSYPLNYYGMSFTELSKKVQVNSDLWDIKNNQKYNYAQCVSNYVKIDNSKPFSLSLSNVGVVVTLLLEKANEDNDFVVKLNSNPYEHLYIKAKDYKVTKVKLICTGISDDYGPQFEVYEYSGTIEIH